MPIYSTALGRRAEGQAFGAGYWARNLREPVLFSTAVSLLADDGVTIFLELGPHPILLPSVQQTVPTATMIACARRDEPEKAAFLTMLGSLWTAGMLIDWQRVMPEGGTTVRLPLYPWQRERHWADVAEMRPAGAAVSSACLRPDEASRGWLYRLEWRLSEASATGTMPDEAGARWLVVAGNEAMGIAVSVAFAAAGVTSEVVPVCRLEAALQEQATAARRIHGIVVLAADDQDAAFLPLRVLQSYLASNSALNGLSHPRFWFVTFGAQSVISDQAERVSVDQAALWGAGRVVAEEHPDLWGGLVDLDPAAAPSVNAGWLTRSLLAHGGEDQIALRQGRRYALRLMPAGPDFVSSGLRWREDAAYLITGGLGGVGLQIARAMAAGGARRLILAGRTALPARERWSAEPSDTAAGQRIAAVRTLESMGVAVHTPAVDVSDEGALRSFLDHYAADGWPPIRGVIHVAVALNNRLAGAMDVGTFDSVVRSKMRSAQLLDRLLPGLDLFVLFSSIGAFLPHPGVANYAAANTGLDALAQDRRARGLPALSIAWGPWENAGLALSEAGEHAILEMGRLGIQAIPTERAAALFGWLCGGSAATVAVMPADWARFQQARSGRPGLLFKALLAGLPAKAVEPSALLSQLQAAGPDQRRRILEPLIRSAVGHVLKIAPSRLDGRKSFGDMGLSSLLAIELRNRLEGVLGRPLSATLAWNYPTIEAIVGYLAEDEPAASRGVTPTVPPLGGELIELADRRGVAVRRSRHAGAARAACRWRAMNDTLSPLAGVSAFRLALMAKQVRAQAAQALQADPIAIVGMACRLPGGADTPDRFWQLMRDSVCAVRDVPPDRWNGNGWYDPDLSTAGKAVTKSGSFLDRIDAFDAGYFGIPPREAERMDPQQRLFLEVAIEALDDAGFSKPMLAGSRTGVFAASYHNDYAQLQFNDPEAIDLRTLTGTLHSVLANRLSYFLDLRGPSISIDTACSASLVAVHLACQSLRLGESNIAIAGGVSLMIAPELLVSMSKVGFMAPDGRCKTFDEQADGFGRGEGCSIVVLKRLSDVIADADRVLAVIRGFGSQSGRAFDAAHGAKRAGAAGLNPGRLGLRAVVA